VTASVIKEFLVGLGFKIDANSEQKFTAGIKSATAGAVALGNVYADAAEKVVKAVAQMASGLEDLYFMAQRTKSSAENIQALGYAASQMGSSVEGARGSIEAMAKFLRENPGGESLIHSIGVQTRDTNGALRDTTEIMVDIGRRLSGMPQYRAVQYANVLGIDYKTLVALEQGVGNFGTRYKDMLRRFGLNVDKATEQSHRLMVAWRDMKASAGILSSIVGTTLIGVFDELQHRWESLDQTTRDNIKTGAEWAAGIAAIVAVISGGPLAWIAALGAALLALWDDYQVWKEGGKSLIDWGKWEPGITMATNAVKILGNAIKTAFEWLEKLSDKVLGGTKVGDWIGEKVAQGMAALGDKDAQEAIARTEGRGATPSRGLPDTVPDDYEGRPVAGPRGIRNNNPGNLRTGPGGSFGRYDTPGAGLSALARQLRLYFNGGSAAAGHRKLQTIREILGRYAPPNENNTGAYINAVAKQMGVGADARLNLNDPQQMAALMRGIVQHENGQNPYSAEMFRTAAGGGARAASTGAKIDQTVEVNIHGGGNPHEIEGAVRSGVSGANDRLLRNLRGATS
jgi:hypothetical protein